MLNALWDFRFAIVLAAAALLLCLLEWSRAKAVLYALMLQAKRMAKDAVLQSGQEQEEWVVRKAYQFLPLSFRVFLSKDTMRKMVRWLFAKGKDYIDDGQLNGSV